MTITNVTRAIAALGGLFSLAMVIVAGDRSSLLLIALMVIFGAWAVAPFLLAHVKAPSFEEVFMAGILLTLATLAAAAFSIFAYWTTFVDNPKPDAQDGLILVFVPLYQLVGVWVVSMAARFVSKIQK